MAAGTLTLSTTSPLKGIDMVNAINVTFAALANALQSGTAPTTTSTGLASLAGISWHDTTNKVLNIRNQADTAWIPILHFDETNSQLLPFIGGGNTTIASASTCDLGSKNETSLNITGTTGITSFGTSMKPGQIKKVTFAAALTLTYNASSMILPGAANITTISGDMAEVECLSSGNYQVTYFPISGAAVVSSSGALDFRNRIINGDMRVDQRNSGASFTVTGSGQYTLDRWCAFGAVTSKFSVQQNAGSVTPPVGFAKYLGVTSLSSYSVGATEYFFMEQQIEGQNVADLAWGTASAKAVILSFWVYSSLTGTFGGALRNSSGLRSYPFTYSIPVANTWTKISVSIPGDTSGTWPTDTSSCIRVDIGLGAGSTWSGAAGSWSSNNYVSATGAVSVVGTNGATFYITGIQLEQATAATAFEYLPIGISLSLCQRYYRRFTQAAQNPWLICLAWSRTTTDLYWSIQLSVEMRAVPTISFSNISYNDGGAAYSPTIGTNFSTTNLLAASSATSGMTSFRVGGLGSGGSNAYIDGSAEL